MRLRWYLFAAGAFALALIALFPLRTAVDWSVGEESLLSARQVGGTIWDGRIGEAMVGRERLGTFDVSVSPLPLLIGRVEARVARDDALEGPLTGGFVIGGGTEGVTDLTGRFAVGRLAAPLPVDALIFEDVDALFEDGVCVKAGGRITAVPAAGLGALSRSLSGEATCGEDGRLVASLGDERGGQAFVLSVDGAGAYDFTLNIGAVPAQFGELLAESGFTRTGSGYRLTQSGRVR